MAEFERFVAGDGLPALRMVVPEFDLDTIAALLEAATPLPWDGHHHTIFEPVDNTPDGQVGAEVADVDHPEDADLIVAAVNSLPALVAVARWAQDAPHVLGCRWYIDAGPDVGPCTCGHDEALAPFGADR